MYLRALVSMASGLGGASPSAAMNAFRSSDNIGFQRRSNAIVLAGLPLNPVPQTEPEK